jgi:hypothetical protein
MARTKATHRRSQAHQRQREARCAALIGIPSAAAAEEPDKQVVNDHHWKCNADRPLSTHPRLL